MKKILLLDDDLDILQIIEALFIMEQFDVKTTRTCNGLISLAEEYHPDVIILDYCLTDGNDGEQCRLLKAHPILRNVPVIILSAYSKPGFDFMASGCDDFMSKPFDINNLLACVNRWLHADGHRAIHHPHHLNTHRSSSRPTA